jgi:ATP-dependent Clp protease ATP-binding subunit ClpB
MAAKNEELLQVQKEGKMLSEEVDGDMVAEVVAKWTGVPCHDFRKASRPSW